MVPTCFLQQEKIHDLKRFKNSIISCLLANANPNFTDCSIDAPTLLFYLSTYLTHYTSGLCWREPTVLLQD